MRAAWLLLLFVAPVQAAVWEDPIGDQQFTVQAMDDDTGWQDGGGDYELFPYLDLVSVEFGKETAEDWTLEITVASLANGNEPQSHRRSYYGITFDVRDVTWRAFFDVDRDADETRLLLQSHDEYRLGDGSAVRLWSIRETLEATRDDLTFTGHIPKSAFRSDTYVPLRSGDVLRGVAPFAVGHSPFGCPGAASLACLQGRDLAEPATDVVVSVDDPTTGHLVMFSEQPWRGSNGAPTTYLYTLDTQNLGTTDDVLSIQVQSPAEWTVRSPAAVAIPAGAREQFAVAVTVPFAHAHGVEKTLEIRATSTLDPNVAASTQLGVVWHDPAQPGGHHPRISLHAHEGLTFLDTTAQEDPAHAEPYLSDRTPNGPASNETWTWHYPLQPGLRMGLDFMPGDVSGESTFTLPAAVDVTATARLMLSTEPPTLLAQQTQTGSWPEGDTPVEWRMAMAPGADRFPLAKHVNLYMQFDIQYERLEPTMGTVTLLRPAPGMDLEGNWFTLPLQEYHDVIGADLASTAARLSMSAEQPDRLVNPGGTAIIEYELSNGAAQVQGIDWDITGSNAEWGRLLEGTYTKIAAGSNTTLRLVVTAPEDATDGAEASLLITGTERATGVQVFGRALATVTTTTTVIDQAALVAALEPEPGKVSPSIAVPMMFAALVLLGRRR